MKLKKLLSALAVSSVFAMGAAHAAPVVVDTGTFASPYLLSGDADSITAPVYYFGLNWEATSTYTDNNSNPYGNVGSLGVGDYVTDSGAGTVSFLNSGNKTMSAEATEGMGVTYGLLFEYSGLTGVVSAVVPDGPTLGVGAFYSPGGIINLYADTTADVNGDFDNSNDVLLMTLKVLGSSGTIGNFSIYTQVTYALDNTFSIEGLDIGDIVSIQGVEAKANFNNAGPYPTEISSDPLVWERSSTLNGNMQFKVSEPGALALLGLGLAGLGFARRNKKQA